MLLCLSGGLVSAQVTVCQSGNCSSQTIQGAINQAGPGQTVQVVDTGATTYVENLDFLGKDIIVEVAAGAGPITILPALSSQPTVSFVTGEGRSTVLRGFEITGATDATAILCSASAPTIELNKITGNGSSTLGLGGGLSSISAAPLVSANEFSQNLCGASGGALLAVGAAAQTGEILELTGNEFSGNVASFRGGGVALEAVGAAELHGNQFSSNDVAQGWPIHCDTNNAPGGGALAVLSTGASPVVLLENEFVDNHSWQFGGAILCDQSSPTIGTLEGATFSWNVAECDGGGMALVYGSSPAIGGYVLENCFASVSGGGIAAMFGSNPVIRMTEFKGCVCHGIDPPGGPSVDAYGGGLYAIDSAPELRQCRIEDCAATGPDGAYGGGIAVLDGAGSGDTSVILAESVLIRNQAHTAGGGFYYGREPFAFGSMNQKVTLEDNLVRENGTMDFITAEPLRGGGIAIEGGNALILRNTIIENRASQSGAGIHAADLFDLSAITGNMVVKNSLEDMFGPTTGAGTGIWCSGDLERILHNTVARNRADSGTVGGGIFVAGGTAEVANTIAWKNEGQTDIDGNPLVLYSDVDKPGGWVNGAGNFRAHPSFVSPINDDFHLRIYSRCINRGNHLIPGILAEDIDGEDRIMDIRTEVGADEVDLPNPITPR